MHNHRDLLDAEYMIDEDTNSVIAEHGVPQFFEMDGTEKIYADYQLTVTNAGGHSSEPVPDNAIYILADGLRRLGRFAFPFELNNVTRSYYERMSGIETGQRAADMKAILLSPPDKQAIERLSRDPIDNAIQRTTCVATRLEGGHANNALPQKAQAVVNCRILPGHTPEEVRQDLIAILGNPSIVVRYITAVGKIADQAPADKGFAPATPNPDLMQPLEKVVGTVWPGLVVVPTMAVGASDAVYSTAAGIPTFGLGGIAVDRDDQRMHGRDERVRIQSFYTANEFTYRLVKALTTH
jgi:acetylornithine deacetylase/succinyl-diaminopimelate desuccinylase-like protein